MRKTGQEVDKDQVRLANANFSFGFAFGDGCARGWQTSNELGRKSQCYCIRLKPKLWKITAKNVEKHVVLNHFEAKNVEKHVVLQHFEAKNVEKHVVLKHFW